jgi:glucokinase
MVGIDQALLADIGGTNARLALLDRNGIGQIEHLRVADYASAGLAIGAFLGRHDIVAREAAAVIAVAGPVESGCAALTNSSWQFDAANLQREFGFHGVHLLNDFEAQAWSLPALGPADLVSLGGEGAVPGAPMVVAGPGTGFGAACLITRESSRFAMVTEAGHATLPVVSAREAAVVDRLRRQFDHVSIERVLSGPGLENLCRALADIDGVRAPSRDAASITQHALDGSCPVSHAALELFCALLGTVCGNLALTFAARGGIYIAGGIAPRIAEFLARSTFRDRFEAKGRFQTYLRGVPVNIVMHSDAGLLGLKTFLEANGRGAR